MAQRRRPKRIIDYEWRVPPKQIAANVEGWKDQIEAAGLELMEELASEAETEMKQDAPWTDQTGDARRGLSGSASQAQSGSVRLSLSHGVPYGKWLELANAGRYAIVTPTYQKYIERFQRRMRQMMKKR
jgi:hypothetical protein